ncbi:DNA polymerase I superfamily [Synechococcus sp. PCC 7335]|nr:DNA polymerase I superfamily [Synechococcus sp. PCC 7335]
MDNLEAQKPDYAAITFDLSEPTFRHEITDTYKAGRAETPEEFTEDVENLKALLSAFQLPIFSLPGYEADDMIGTLAVRAKGKGYRVKILSGDQDLFQLIDPEEAIKVMYLSTTFGSKTSTTKEYGNAEVLEKLSILPSQVVDYKALCGDTSDNIPGVKGIGKKTAVKLLDTYGDLETIYASIDELKGAVKKRLETGKEDAAQSKQLAKIKTDVPLETDLETCKLEGFNPEDVIPALKQLELQHFVNRLSKLQASFGGESDYQPRPKAAPVPSDFPDDFEDPDLAFFSAEETDAVTSMGLDSVSIQPMVVTTDEQLKKLAKTLKAHTDTKQPVAWDTETNSIDPLEADLVGIGCCWGEGPTALAYIPVGHTAGEQLSMETVLSALKPILEDQQYPKVFQNAKYDRLVLRRAGVSLTGVVFDPMLASYVLNPENSHNLSDLALRYLELTTVSYTDLVPKGKTIGEVAIAEVAQYCGSDVHTTYRLVPLLKADLQEVPDLATLYTEVELPVEPVLAKMEATGIRIDKAYLNQFSKQLESDLAGIEKAAYDAAGEEFNLGSPKQLSELFFEKLGLDKRKSRKNKTGYSTDAATLEKLQGDHPVVDSVVEYRTLSKLKSTYVDALPALIRPNTGRVHTDFNQAITTTGRLSSSNPNLQNIPTRTAFSRQIRQAFLPKEGWQLVAADYSQIELRILAHLSEEPILIKTYREDEDVHRLTATLLFDKDKDEITVEERRMAKVINFGVIYGMGAARFAREMDIHRLDAKTFIDRFNQRYPNVFEYLQQMQREAIAYGYVKTIAGRRRYFNFTTRSLQALKGTDPTKIDLSSLRTNGYDAGLLRAAANAPIQGSSADIIKVAMIRLHELLKGYQANMLLQVHDELIFEVPPDEWEELQPKIEQTMEDAVSLAVPLKVEAQAGKNWMEAK